MREILFRGKRIDNDEWIEGNFGEYALGSGEKISCISIPKANSVAGSLCYDVDPETVGQYTGLTDKNGKKIFEGDILEGIRYGNEERAEVLWIDKAASWGIRYSFREKNESGYTSWLNSAWFRTINDARGPVVIGNIHDNPELLEVGE